MNLQTLKSMQFVTEAIRDFAVAAKPGKILLDSRMGTCILCKQNISDSVLL